MSEHSWPIRIVVLVVYIAHRLGVGRWSGFGPTYRFLYPYYKKWFDGGLIRFITQNPHWFKNGHLIDLGANFGSVAEALNKVRHPDYRLLLVEPAPECIDELKHRFGSLSHCTVVSAAASDRNGRAKFFLHPYHKGDHRLDGLQSSTEFGASIEVDVVSLDSLLKSLGIDRQTVGFVKMDLQGGEWKALQGMEGLLGLGHDLCLCLEFSSELVQNGGTSPEQLFDYLKKFGFGYIHRITGRGGLQTVSHWSELIQYGCSDIILRRRL